MSIHESSTIVLETTKTLHESSVICEVSLLAAIATVCFVSIICFVGSIILNNYSIVDRLWSLTPPLYVIVMAHTAARYLHTSIFHLFWHHPKLLLMTVLPVLWGIRLTYNFYRKGGYGLHGEDYRWDYVRYSVLNSEIAFQLLNIVFISTLQNVLLFAIVYPFYLVLYNIVYNGASGAITALDILVATAFLFFLLIETITDEQQWAFYTDRKIFRKHEPVVSFFTTQSISDLLDGFLTTGLFKYSRHLNFLSEQLIWVSYSLFILSEPYLSWSCDVFHTDRYYLWLYSPYTAFVGCAALVLLFQGSTALTEHISVQKYPKYQAYKQRVNRFVPSLRDWPKVARELIHYVQTRCCA